MEFTRIKTPAPKTKHFGDLIKGELFSFAETHQPAIKTPTGYVFLSTGDEYHDSNQPSDKIVKLLKTEKIEVSYIIETEDTK